jgi:hypothetical protein
MHAMHAMRNGTFVVQGHCTVWVGSQIGLSCTLLSHGPGCLIPASLWSAP